MRERVVFRDADGVREERDAVVPIPQLPLGHEQAGREQHSRRDAREFVPIRKPLRQVLRPKGDRDQYSHERHLFCAGDPGQRDADVQRRCLPLEHNGPARAKHAAGQAARDGGRATKRRVAE